MLFQLIKHQEVGYLRNTQKSLCLLKPELPVWITSSWFHDTISEEVGTQMPLFPQHFSPLAITPTQCKWNQGLILLGPIVSNMYAQINL